MVRNTFLLFRVSNNVYFIAVKNCCLITIYPLGSFVHVSSYVDIKIFVCYKTKTVFKRNFY